MSALAKLPALAFSKLACEEWLISVPPVSLSLMADFDPMYMEKAFYIAKRKGKPDIDHHGEPNDLRRRFEITEGGLGHAGQSRAVSHPLSS